jgi:CheY-like chemotaxis protein
MARNSHLNLLLVEDDPAHAEIVKRNLADFHVPTRLVHVTDGQEALDYLDLKVSSGSPPEQPRPDLILLDLRLPKVDGLEVLAHLKAKPELRDIPTIILSTSATESDMVKAYAKGASSYLVKPVAFDKFKSLMEAFGFYWLAWNQYPESHGQADPTHPSSSSRPSLIPSPYAEHRTDQDPHPGR